MSTAKRVASSTTLPAMVRESRGGSDRPGEERRGRVRGGGDEGDLHDELVSKLQQKKENMSAHLSGAAWPVY